MNQTEEIIIKAFPSSIEDEVKNVLSKIDLKAEHDPSDTFSIFIRGEELKIPQRIYFESKNLTLSHYFSSLQHEILNCLYSRHHDGYIREQCLAAIIGSNNIWTVPFVIRLLGEYVIEILHVIKSHLSEINGDNYKAFLKENSQFYETNKRRVVSYWACYYRDQYRNREQYVGFQITDYLDNMLKK